MKVIDCGCYVTVAVSQDDVDKFKARWPCNGLPSRSVWFTFEKLDGDLVDMKHGWEQCDDEALLALSHDACNYAAKRLNLPNMQR